MSDARFGFDSDVYVFQTCGSDLVCCDCRLLQSENSENWPSFCTAREALEHLKTHTEAGHRVPDYTIEQIKADFTNLDLHIQVEHKVPNYTFEEIKKDFSKLNLRLENE